MNLNETTKAKLKLLTIWTWWQIVGICCDILKRSCRWKCLDYPCILEQDRREQRIVAVNMLCSSTFDAPHPTWGARETTPSVPVPKAELPLPGSQIACHISHHSIINYIKPVSTAFLQNKGWPMGILSSCYDMLWYITIRLPTFWEVQ